MENSKLLKTFQIGTYWKSFKIENSNLSPNLTPFVIYQNLKVFKESYKVTSDFISNEDLICFELQLEELPRKQEKKNTKRKTKETEVKIKTYIFKVAVSIEDAIMFCNRTLSQKFRELFSRVFKATELTPYDLFGSPPHDLLLFYRQSLKQAKEVNRLADEIGDDTLLDPLAEPQTVECDASLKIGSSCRPCPKIKKLTATIKGLSLNSSEDHMKGLKLDEVELEFQGPSILEFYLKFAEANYIKEVPDWLAACRRSGKTYQRIHYN